MVNLSLDDLEDEGLMRELYWDDGYSLVDIGNMAGCTAAAVAYWFRKFGIPRRPTIRRGEDNPCWKGGHSDYYGKNWPEMRESTLDRDDYRCRRCGLVDSRHQEKHGCSLHVHHITPMIEFDEKTDANKLSNLITLCRSCHAALEGIPIDNREVAV